MARGLSDLGSGEPPKQRGSQRLWLLTSPELPALKGACENEKSLHKWHGHLKCHSVSLLSGGKIVLKKKAI